MAADDETASCTIEARAIAAAWIGAWANAAPNFLPETDSPLRHPAPAETPSHAAAAAVEGHPAAYDVRGLGLHVGSAAAFGRRDRNPTALLRLLAVGDDAPAGDGDAARAPADGGAGDDYDGDHNILRGSRRDETCVLVRAPKTRHM